MKTRNTGAACVLTLACAAGIFALAHVGLAIFRTAPAPAAAAAPDLLGELRAIAADPARRAELAALAPRLAAEREFLIETARTPEHPRRAEAIFALRFVGSALAEACLADLAGCDDPELAALAADGLEWRGVPVARAPQTY